MYENCVVCHHEGGYGPFPLVTYEAVAKRARQVAEVTRSGFMPPWQPEPGFNEFVGQRGLTELQIENIGRWFATGTPEGRPEDLPEVPRFEDGWALGRPDLVLTMSEAFELAADGRDVYRNFAIPVPVEETRFVRALDFRPGNSRAVHHATIRVDRTHSSRDLDMQDPEPGFESMIFSKAIMPDGHFLGWTPGKVIADGNGETAWRVGPGTDLVLQLHMQPSGKNETVRSEIGLYFSRDPPTKPLFALVLQNKDVDIPPGDANYSVSDSYRLPVDVSALSVYPHAHYLGKRLHAHALLPDGRRQWLVRIDDWDFNWQDEYRYAEPLFLPKGTLIHMEFGYDNSEANVRNPNQPPKRVVFGGQSTDEMAELVLQVTPKRIEDLAVLVRDFQEQSLKKDIAYLEKRVKAMPSAFEPRFELGVRYRQRGSLEKARAAFEAAVPLDPENPDVLFNLGAVLGKLGEREAAERCYRRALNLDPGHAETHLNLGFVLESRGDRAGAERHYREAIAGKPGYALAYNNLGFLLAGTGRHREAIEHYRKALALEPDLKGVHTNLGESLAVSGRFEEAVDAFKAAVGRDPEDVDALSSLCWILATHATLKEPRLAAGLGARACNLTQFREPVPLMRLAAAHAALGEFQKAIELLEMALSLPNTPSFPGLARDLERYLALFRKGEPLVMGTSSAR